MHGLIKRFGLGELSFNRIKDAIWRRIADLPDALAWDSPSGHTYRHRLQQMKNRHLGRRCFILGNGPSLAKMDLSPLRREVTFGLNRVYLLCQQNDFWPSYYVCVNELVLTQFADEIQSLPMTKFLNWNARHLFTQSDPTINFVKMRLGFSDRMQRDVTKQIDGGGTVTFAALQLAFFMGFETVVLIGVDHHFADRGIPNQVILRTSGRDENHFHPDYFPPGSKWQLPDLRRSEVAYAIARTEFEKVGRRILDATVDGHCQVFEKVEFMSLFPRPGDQSKGRQDE
jgi:hypothetical protein